MPDQPAKDQDDTASIRSSVSSIFPSFSSNRKGKRRPLSNLWVFTNNSRARSGDQGGTAGRPQSSAAFYGNNTLDDTDGRKTPTRSAIPRQSHIAGPEKSPLPPVSDGDTTPTSAQTHIPSTPHDLSGRSSLRRNGKLLRARPSALNSPIASVSPSLATTPKTGLFNEIGNGSDLPILVMKDSPVAVKGDCQLDLPSKNAGISGAQDLSRPMPVEDVIPRRKRKDLKAEPGRSLRKPGSREGPLDIAQEIREDDRDSRTDVERGIPGLSTDDMDQMIESFKPKRVQSRGNIRPSAANLAFDAKSSGQGIAKGTNPRRTSSRDLHSIAAELSGGKVVPIRSASKPQAEPKSIDDIVRRHAYDSPEVFGLSRKAVDNLPICQEAQGNDTLDNVLLTRDLMLQRLESNDPSVNSGSTVSSNNSGPPMPPQAQAYYAATASSDTRVSLASSNSWESLKRRLDNDADPDRAISRYLKSRRLNRIVTLKRPGQAGQVLSVAEAGDPEGYPVLVFLGLGCVRYLIALYDEVARGDNIRLICIDRWGLGKSQEVAPEQRGLLAWADVVKEVMDQMEVPTFGMMAHSAGVPYALATALKMKDRVSGTIHLLAPWVNIDVDGGYKWLRYVPSSVIKTAQATEWKFHGWRLGSLPASPSEGIGYTPPKSARSVMGTASGYFVGRLGRPQVSPGVPQVYTGDWASRGCSSSRVDLGVGSKGDPTGDTTSRPPVSPLVRPKSSAGRLARRLSQSVKPNGDDTIERLRVGTHQSSNLLRLATSNASATSIESTADVELSSRSDVRSSRVKRIVPARTTSLPSIDLERPSSRAQSTLSAASSVVPLAGETSLATAILQASHAEALQGGSADLMSILGRDSKDWGFSYSHIEHPCRVWLGDKDDKIGERGVRWMEQEMKHCQVEIVAGEGHNLMTSSRVVLMVFSRLQPDVRAWMSRST